jgi:arylformamidase
MPSSLIDLSHAVEDGMITYKGLPAPVICDFWSREHSQQFYAEGTTFQIGKIELVSNTGTYVDSPFHRFENGKDLSQLPLESLADLDAVVIRATEAGRPIDRAAFGSLSLKGKAVLIHTGWDRHWRTDPYFDGTHPHLTRDAAEHLVQSGATFVGIDTYNIDNTTDKTRIVHTTLLGADIPICEHMTGLAQLPDNNFRFFALPVKIKNMGTFPVRAIGVVPGNA